MSERLTRKRLREEEQRKKDDDKKAKVINNITQNNERTRADVAREQFLNRLLGSAKIEDELDFTHYLDQNLFPAHDSFGACKGIEPNDLFICHGVATSRAGLRGWVATFKDKSAMPTDPLNRVPLTNDDLISLGFSPEEFLAIRLQQTTQSAQTASSSSALASPIIIDLRKKETFDDFSDVDFAVSIINSFYENKVPPSEDVCDRIKRGKCFDLLFAYDAIYAIDSISLPLWLFLLKILGDKAISWNQCLSEIYTNNIDLKKVQREVTTLQRAVTTTASRVVSFDHILQSLFTAMKFDEIFAFVLALDSVISRSKNDFKNLVETATNTVLKINSVSVPVQVAGILIGLSLQWFLPISHLVLRFYEPLSQESDKESLVHVWTKVAQYDKFKQSSILVAYFCQLPESFLETFVHIAIKHRSRECANYYYEQLSGEAERFFALKTAIDFGNIDFLQKHCLSFNVSVSSAHNKNVLLAMAVENGDLSVVKSVLRNQTISINIWCNLLVSTPSSNFETFLHIWNLGVTNFHNAFKDSVDVHDAVLSLCRIGHLEKLKYWICNSTHVLFEVLHQRLLLECCSSAFAKSIFDFLIATCKIRFGKKFSVFFCNGALMIRAASRGRDLIVKELLPKLQREFDTPLNIIDNIITESIVAATKGSKRTTFFVLWDSVGASFDRISQSSREDILTAGRTCQDDYIKEALQLIPNQQEHNNDGEEI